MNTSPARSTAPGRHLDSPLRRSLAPVAVALAALALAACDSGSSDNGGGGGGGGGVDVDLASLTCSIGVGQSNLIDGRSCDGLTMDDLSLDYHGLNQVYMAPDGVDGGNDCSLKSTPCKTFAHAIDQMNPGDGLILLDGFYTIADNGSLETHKRDGSPVSPKSGSLPSGVDVNTPTVATAENPGSVGIEGGLRIGYSNAKREFIVVHGLTFFDGGGLVNTRFVTVKNAGFEKGLGMGAIDHSEGNTCNLFEDTWVWGQNFRTGVRVYRSHHNLLRRVLVRWDGCDQDWCGEKSGNGSSGLTVYNANNNRLENILLLDRSMGNNQIGRYADYSTAQHDSNQPPQPGGELLAENEWYGNMSINSEDSALKFEADAVGAGITNTVDQFVAINTVGGFSMDGAHRPYEGNAVFDIDNVKMYTQGGDFYVGCDRIGGNLDDTSVATPPTCGVHTIGSVEEGPYVAGAGLAATHLPQQRYGTSDDLWPWPNEDCIKKQVCVVDGKATSRGLCGTTGTLTEYIFAM